MDNLPGRMVGVTGRKKRVTGWLVSQLAALRP